MAKPLVVAGNLVGPHRPHWKGGKKDGYVRMNANLARQLYPNCVIADGRRNILEHIAIMSHHLGRALYPGENVHHKNGVRDDNRWSNLELKIEAHGPGQSVEETVNHAIEMLRRYRPDLLISSLQK